MTERNNAINEILKSVGNRLYDYIERRVPSVEDAEDIFQDVLLQFTASFDTIISFERILGWLYAVSRNKITDMFRKRKSIPEIDNMLNEDGDNLQEIIADLEINPEDIYEKIFLEKEIEKAINSLPIKQKEIFIQNEIENKSFREISSITNVPINTLLSQKRYAILALRKQLIKSYKEVLEINK